MIRGGNATVYVSDFDASLNFYTQVLGLKLRYRAASFWAEVDAGPGLVIGIHPQTPHSPKPGTPGAIQIGLNVIEPLEDVMKKLSKRGVTFMGPMIADGEAGKFVSLKDPDGNSLYLWETLKPAAKK